MLLIRRFEEKVEERFRAGELPGFLHVAIGQEAVAVGVCRALEEGDVIASTHRAHGHTIAKGTHPNEVMAELYGKVEGCSHGYGGSMHLYDFERGNLGANAVVGGGLPGIVGAGLAFKMRGEPRVAVAFFGDGATEEGVFAETPKMPEMMWKQLYVRGPVLNPLAQILSNADSLQLTRVQADSVAALNRWYTVRLDSVWTPIAKEFAELPANYSQDAAYARYREGREASVDLLIKVVPHLKGMLSSAQHQTTIANVALVAV
jgi:hypothetical protein